MEVFKKKFVDIPRFTLWGDSPIEGKKARFLLSFRDGNPRFTVYTGAQGKDGVISFPADVPTAVYFLSVLKEIANGQNGTKTSIDSLTSVYENEKPTAAKKVVSTIHLGKSSEGIVYIAMIAENRPKIVFEIKPSEYHIFKDKDNTKIPDSVISPRMAVGIADVLLGVISDVMVRHGIEDIRPMVGSAVNDMSAGSYGATTAAKSNIDILEDVPY